MPFRLKITAIIGLTILLISMVFSSYYALTNFAHNVVFSVFSDHTLSVLQRFYTQILDSSPQISQHVMEHEKKPELYVDEITLFNSKTSDYFSIFPWIKINILDADQHNYWSSSSHTPFYASNNSLSEGFHMAQEGKIWKEYIAEAAFIHKDKSIEGSLIHAFIPIFTPDNRVSAVAEVYYDVSSVTSLLIRFRIIVNVSLISLCIIISSVLTYISWKSRRIITKQHEANLELTQAKVRAETQNEEKSKFLANISHELRTPLNAIIGFSEIMKEQSLGPIGHEQYVEYVRDINMSGSHLLSLINDILDFSKAEANKLDVDYVELDLNKTIKSALRLVLTRAEEAKVALEDKLPEEHILIKADPKRMKQVILNLVSNSVKFTPQEGKITVTAWKNTLEQIIYIEVKDTGIGIDPKNIAKAMSTFGQIENNLSRRYEGTGLGLPLTKKLVELMGGKFTITSELGLGTTVNLAFPIKQDETTNMATHHF